MAMDIDLSMDAPWPGDIDWADLAFRCGEAAGAVAPELANPSLSVSLLLASDGEVQVLNREWRGKDKPTNVLSFPAGLPGQLGDVALALGVVRREAREAGRKTAAHFAHLVAHGALHLAGHDHLDAGEARRMERAEARVMRRLGLPNPWRGIT